MSLGLGVVMWLAFAVLAGLPDATALRNVGAMAEATVAYDRYDEPAFTVFLEQRIEVPLDEVSPHVVRAILAVEDQRFYDHYGIDGVRILGAALANLRHGQVTQGASTITQQLARQVFLTSERTIRRKLKEAVLAVRLERRLTKEEILELYLNKVYFGNSFYGIEAASLGYFGKHAADLELAEAALLAGLVKAPALYAPTVSLSRAQERRDLVLRVMHEAGVIDEATQESASTSQIELVNALQPTNATGKFFEEEVRKQLTDLFGPERVYEGGLRVFTTLDPAMQGAAEREVASGLEAIARRKRQGEAEDEPLQAALVALDPATGHVRAMVGGRDFLESRFNRATQARRQPGSAFKPFVYAAALEHGTPASTVIGGLDEPIVTAQGDWTPEDGHADTEAVTMRAALRVSSNRAAVQMLQRVGIPEALHYARQLGLGPLPAVPSLALGSGEVTVLSMTRAFAAFANEGILTTPTLIRRVESADGELLYEAVDETSQAVSATTAFILTNMLADVVDSGTGWPARQAGFMKPAAGKTGTTNDFHDAWFVGYTPHLATGVWVGYDRPRTIIGNGYAGQLAAPIWGRFMAEATREDLPTPFALPRDIVPLRICRLSGMLARDGCEQVEMTSDGEHTGRESTVYTEYFAPGTEPLGFCPLHRAWHSADAIARGADTPAPTIPVETAVMKVVAEIAVAPKAQAPSPRVPSPQPTARASDSRDSEPKKRGFWSRLFGRNRDADRKDK